MNWRFGSGFYFLKWGTAGTEILGIIATSSLSTQGISDSLILITGICDPIRLGCV